MYVPPILRKYSFVPMREGNQVNGISWALLPFFFMSPLQCVGTYSKYKCWRSKPSLLSVPCLVVVKSSIRFHFFFLET